MPRRPPISPCWLLIAAACAQSGEPESGTSVSVQLPLELGVATATPVAAAAPQQERAQAAPASAAKSGTDEGALALDAWHRTGLEARRVPSGERAAELAEFQQALGGQAAMIQARWAQRAPQSLGATVQGLAEAFAREGSAGLERALDAVAATDPARLAFSELLAVRALELQETQRAGRALGTLLTGAIAVGYPRERILEWSPLAVGVAERVGKVLPGTPYTVASGDSYWKICSRMRKRGQTLEPGWVKMFNRRRGDNIQVGETLQIPSTPLRIECWRQLRLTAVFAGDLPVRLYASSSGKLESPTPLGEFTLKICEAKPIYYPPGAPSVPYGNPANPLGERWLGFAEDKQYGLHGTNSEATVGSFETGGCVRLHNADAIELFDLAGPGTRVRINP